MDDKHFENLFQDPHAFTQQLREDPELAVDCGGNLNGILAMKFSSGDKCLSIKRVVLAGDDIPDMAQEMGHLLNLIARDKGVLEDISLFWDTPYRIL